ncbi:hypothetical protein ACEQ8H_002182 [Pleosporales sp. CAS-2024a]
MWAEVNGERKKVAWYVLSFFAARRLFIAFLPRRLLPYRPSLWAHLDCEPQLVFFDSALVSEDIARQNVTTGTACERVVINYTIPKSSECACPSERAKSVAAVAGSSRIQKGRRKSTAVNATSLERAIRAGQDADTDTSSYIRTPTERSASNEASPPSSASSTPRLRPAQQGSSSTSTCCQSKPTQQMVQQPTESSACCSNKAKQAPEPVQVKSCCAGKSAQPNITQTSPFQSHPVQQFGQQIQFQLQQQTRGPHYPTMQTPGTPAAAFPFGLGAPIYNHAAAAYNQSSSLVMSPVSHQGAGPQISQQPTAHNCHCGESCSCFGCAAHPNNATMMEYVRLMAQFQYTGGFGTMAPPLYDMPTYPHHAAFGAEAHHGVNFHPMNQGFSIPTATQMSFLPSMTMESISGPAMAAPSAWQQTATAPSSISQPQYLEPSSYVTPVSTNVAPVVFKTEELAATPIASSPSDEKDEDTPTLSPSSFFWNEMEIPGCNDATGTCQCGDGCECVGCITHGGHNGVQLEMPAMDDAPEFPEFMANTGNHDSGHYIFDSTLSR